MSIKETKEQLAVALAAAEDKKAEDINLLQLPGEASALADFFLICTGNNGPQIRAIADNIDEELTKNFGIDPTNREGYENSEWILLDYVDFVVHVFSANSRRFYDIERLWKSAKRVTAADLKGKTAKKKVAAKKAVAKKAVAVKAAPVKKAPVKAAAKKAAPKKAVAKAPVKKAAAKKVVAKKVAVKSAVKKVAAKKVAVKKVAVKKTAANKTVAKKK